MQHRRIERGLPDVIKIGYKTTDDIVPETFVDIYRYGSLIGLYELIKPNATYKEFVDYCSVQYLVGGWGKPPDV
jgi:hypothetical protein